MIGFTFGFVAFFVNYLMTVLLVVADWFLYNTSSITYSIIRIANGDTIVFDTSGQISPNIYEVMGWVMYNIHNIDLVVNSAREINPTEYLFGIPSIIVYLMPIIVLIIAGYMVGKKTYARDENNVRKTITAGSMLCMGYLPLTLLGYFVFSTSFAVADVFGVHANSIGFDIINTVATMGVFYPILFGGMGAYIATFQQK